MRKERVEAFSDGVFAVAITILVFNVQPPPGVAAGQLWQALGELWPTYAAYAASFTTIGVMWLNHHSIFDRLRQVDRTVQILNLLLLMAIVIVPFPTSLLGHYIPAGGVDARAAATAYAISAVLIGALFSVLWTYVLAHPDLLAAGVDVAAVRRRLPLFALGSVVYIACLFIAQVSPIAVVALCALTATYYAFDLIPAPTD